MIYMLIPEQMNIDIRPLLFIIILPALVISWVHRFVYIHNDGH